MELLNNPAAELQTEHGLFKCPGESGSQRRRRFGAVFQGNKGLYTFYLIYKVFNVV